MTRKVIEVAVGVILSQENAFLLGSRPEGKPYSGYWEFPGGKIEDGESVHEALARELNEELGINIANSEEWEVIEHDYPHAYVRLHLRIVRQWSGNMQGREGQELAWESFRIPEKVTVNPLLPATVIIIDKMRNNNI